MNEKFNPKNSPIDDWTVSPVAPPPAEQAANWGMTNPLKSPFTEAPKDGWKMPEPTFRISDGYCPLKAQDTKNIEAPPTDTASVETGATDEKLASLYAPPAEHEGVSPDMTMHNISLADLKAEIPPAPEQKAASSAQVPVVAQPQPDVSDQFRLEEIEPKVETETKAKSRSAQTIYAVLGILLMTFFAAAFLALVYYLFFYQPAAV